MTDARSLTDDDWDRCGRTFFDLADDDVMLGAWSERHTGPMSADFTSYDEATVRKLDRQHVFHSWSAQDLIDPMPIARAEGSHFWDYDGKRYLDFSSQLVNLNIGHQHPKVVKAIQEQAGRLATVAPGFANDARGEAARLIAEVAPGDLDTVFFTNGGAEANENAVRMARLHTGRPKVLAAYRSYHGSTAGAITLTGSRAAGRPSRRSRASSTSGGPTSIARPSTPRPRSRSASGRWRTCATWSRSRGRTRSPRSSSNRSSARTASSCRRTDTSRACATCATSTASC
ncbi:hypothetical protein GCM10025872_34660 [Barrientosiimonas endolithica]|uniref:Aminotransferase class III n=1 Tax=Barrientosiimonas endolithica TaxID=1535208 RepID=A0ABM8HFM8_9MICO|nr:hypothetical protein GCM10025872_34660 [Barrientosiimonas endolithica]